MRSLKFPALPRATLLWLAVALGSALVWWFSLRPSSASESVAGLAALVLGISAIYGLPLSLIVPRVGPSFIAAEGSRAAFAGIVLLGGILGVLSLALAIEIPMTTW